MQLLESVLFGAFARSVAAINDEAEADSAKAECKDDLKKELLQVAGLFVELLYGEVSRPQAGPGEKGLRTASSSLHSLWFVARREARPVLYSIQECR